MRKAAVQEHSRFVTLKLREPDYQSVLEHARQSGVPISDWIVACIHAGLKASGELSARLDELECALEEARERERQWKDECDRLRREVDVEFRILMRAPRDEEHRLFSVPEFLAARAVEWAESRAATLVAAADLMRDHQRKAELRREAVVVLTEADAFRRIVEAYRIAPETRRSRPHAPATGTQDPETVGKSAGPGHGDGSSRR